MNEEEQIFHDFLTVFSRIEVVIYFGLFSDTRQWVRTIGIRHISKVSLECVILCSEAQNCSRLEIRYFRDRQLSK